MDDDGNFAKIQRKDAWNHLNDISIKEYFPVNFNWKKCVFFIGALVFCIVAMVMPSKAKDEAKNMHNVAKIAEHETKNPASKMESKSCSQFFGRFNAGAVAKRRNKNARARKPRVTAFHSRSESNKTNNAFQ